MWLDTVPSELLGNWEETSDDIIAGIDRPQSIEVSSRGIKWSHVVDDEYVRRFYPFVKANQQGREFVVFCGERAEKTISDRRLLFRVEKGGSFARVYRIIATGISDGEELSFQGRYVLRSR